MTTLKHCLILIIVTLWAAPFASAEQRTNNKKKIVEIRLMPSPTKKPKTMVAKKSNEPKKVVDTGIGAAQNESDLEPLSKKALKKISSPDRAVAQAPRDEPTPDFEPFASDLEQRDQVNLVVSTKKQNINEALRDFRHQFDKISNVDTDESGL
jgi:hypothetical protein